jgi:hypothetical protein
MFCEVAVADIDTVVADAPEVGCPRYLRIAILDIDTVFIGAQADVVPANLSVFGIIDIDAVVAGIMNVVKGDKHTIDIGRPRYRYRPRSGCGWVMSRSTPPPPPDCVTSIPSPSFGVDIRVAVDVDQRVVGERRP